MYPKSIFIYTAWSHAELSRSINPTPNDTARMQVPLNDANFILRMLDSPWTAKVKPALGRDSAALLWLTIPTSCSYNIDLPNPAHLILPGCCLLNWNIAGWSRSAKYQYFLISYGKLTFFFFIGNLGHMKGGVRWLLVQFNLGCPKLHWHRVHCWETCMTSYG